MSRPRLLVIASTFPGRPDDGTPAFVRDLALAESEDFDTTVIVPMVSGAPRHERIGDLEILRFRYFFRRWEDLADGAMLENLRNRRSRLAQVLPFMAAEWLAVRRAVREIRPDLMHVHWIIPQGIVVAGMMRRTPCVVTTLGGDLYGLRNAPARALKRRVVKRAAAITTMNQDMRLQIIALGGAPEATRVMPMGADLTGIRAAAGDFDRIAGRLLFVGRLVEKKGLAYLLDALRAMDTSRFTLTVVGDGPLRTELEGKAAGLPVTFVGQLGRAELAAEYARSEVVVIPSAKAASGDQDGLPVVLLEAMGLGCAVVASDLPGINEVVLDGKTGRLVPPADSSALTAALTELLADSDARRTLGEGARELSDSLSIPAVGARYRALLAEVRAGASASRPM